MDSFILSLQQMKLSDDSPHFAPSILRQAHCEILCLSTKQVQRLFGITRRNFNDSGISHVTNLPYLVNSWSIVQQESFMRGSSSDIWFRCCTRGNCQMWPRLDMCWLLRRLLTDQTCAKLKGTFLREMFSVKPRLPFPCCIVFKVSSKVFIFLELFDILSWYWSLWVKSNIASFSKMFTK